MSDMFVRFLDADAVKATLKTLKDEFNSVPEAGDKLRRVHAPDGDLVFAAMPHPSGKFICRLHREVFEEGGYKEEKPD